MQTYWLNPNMTDSIHSSGSVGDDDIEDDDAMRADRLVNWNVGVLTELLESIVSHRRTRGPLDEDLDCIASAEASISKGDDQVVNQIVPVLELPPYESNGRLSVAATASYSLPKIVKEQLQDFVRTIAAMYRDVPFHCFEHASHVIMSARKLMKRIVNPDVDYQAEKYRNSEEKIARDIYEKTYGIAFDPLMQFAIVFSSLIHDVDHTGISNAELVESGAPLSHRYKRKSVAEQNSVTISWSILMAERYKELRKCIYTTEAELRHFRKLVVNAVMASKSPKVVCPDESRLTLEIIS